MTITVLLAAGFVSYRLWPRPPRSRKTLKVVPFTSYPGFEVWPSFSPDGNAIAFAWNGGANEPIDALDLYVKQLGSETTLRLTHHPAAYLAPAWSPDGRVIAFSRVNRDGSSGIFEVSPLGGPERLLTETHNGMSWQTISWSPDSKLLALLEVDKQGQHVYLLNVETLERRQLRPPPASGCVPWGPVFSPDGRSLGLMCLQRVCSSHGYTCNPYQTKPLARSRESMGTGTAWSGQPMDDIYSTISRTTFGVFRHRVENRRGDSLSSRCSYLGRRARRKLASLFPANAHCQYLAS